MTNDELFAWVMHRFSEVFEERAVLKGGMALRLLDSARATVDIDYVFVPFASKTEVAARIEAVLRRLDGAEVKVKVHSTMVRADLRHSQGAIQVEASAMLDCASIPMASAALARKVGLPSQVVRIMAPDVALAHKLAAWNERRLMRDLYDVYFLGGRVKARPDMPALDARLCDVRSRLPKLRSTRRMTRLELAASISEVLRDLTDAALRSELGGLLPPEELAGLPQRIRATLSRIEEELLTLAS